MSEKVDEVDYYAILGLTRGVTNQEIKCSYQKLAFKYHPDRNPGDVNAVEEFKKISVAYATLSDPDKRRQYDSVGQSQTVVNYDGVNVNKIGTFGKVFCSYATKLGVPLATQLVPNVLIQAKSLLEGKPTEAKLFGLEHGFVYDGSVGAGTNLIIKANFYKVKIRKEWQAYGIIIICKSIQQSKFKLVMFDQRGGVRNLQESARRRGYTVAQLYFVPFNRNSISEFSRYKHRLEDMSTQSVFYFSDTLETLEAQVLEEGDHLLCVYGDDFIKQADYELKVVPLKISQRTMSDVAKIRNLEDELVKEKIEIDNLKGELFEADRKNKELEEQLRCYVEEIQDLLEKREQLYDLLEQYSLEPYLDKNASLNYSKSSNFFSSLYDRIYAFASRT